VGKEKWPLQELLQEWAGGACHAWIVQSPRRVQFEGKENPRNDH